MSSQSLKLAGLSSNVWSADAVTGLFTRNCGIVDSGILDIALSANVDNLNPAGLAQASVLRFTPSSSAFYLAGIAGGTAGRRYKIVNASTSFGWYIYNNAIASAANQFQTPRGFPIFVQPGEEFDIWYDATSSKWRTDWSGAVTTVFAGVVVPALATSALGYVNVSLAGSALAGLTTTDNVVVQPTSDLAAAGVGNGGLLNWRMSASETLRLAFTGALAGGAASFQVSHTL